MYKSLISAEAYAGRPMMVPPHMVSGGDYGVIFVEGAMWRDQRRFSLHTFRNFGFGRNAMESKILNSCNRLISQIKVD